jgi:hypothetical protein
MAMLAVQAMIQQFYGDAFVVYQSLSTSETAVPANVAGDRYASFGYGGRMVGQGGGQREGIVFSGRRYTYV